MSSGMDTRRRIMFFSHWEIGNLQFLRHPLWIHEFNSAHFYQHNQLSAFLLVVEVRCKNQKTIENWVDIQLLETILRLSTPGSVSTRPRATSSSGSTAVRISRRPIFGPVPSESTRFQFLATFLHGPLHHKSVSGWRCRQQCFIQCVTK